MSERRDLVEQVRAWIEKAEHDLRNAEHTMTLEEDCPFDTVCFHCQQCAEKYLKALLVYREIEFPKTHDLILLLNLIRRKMEISLSAEQVQPLNRYSIEARYPGDWYPIDREEASEAIELARGVRDVVRRMLPKEALI